MLEYTPQVAHAHTGVDAVARDHRQVRGLRRSWKHGGGEALRH